MRCLNPRAGKVAVIIDHANNVEKFGYPDSDRDWEKMLKSRTKRSRKPAESDNFNIVTCETCFAVIEAKKIKSGTCPYCDTIVKQNKREKQVELVDLVEAARNEIASKKIDDYHQLKTVSELYEYAKRHGYKRGWAYHIAKSRGLL